MATDKNDLENTEVKQAKSTKKNIIGTILFL